MTKLINIQRQNISHAASKLRIYRSKRIKLKAAYVDKLLQTPAEKWRLISHSYSVRRQVLEIRKITLVSAYLSLC